VTLTQNGTELRPAFDKISCDILDSLYKDIPQQDKDELLRILAKIFSNL
jgi:hypothetical protein